MMPQQILKGILILWRGAKMQPPGVSLAEFLFGYRTRGCRVLAIPARFRDQANK